MKKKDWIVIILILLVAGAAVGANYMLRVSEDASYVKVQVNGKVQGTYKLGIDKEIIINKTNKLRIKDGIVDMTEADCPDQICVNHKPISENRETITCLPNKIVVEVVGKTSSKLDAVTN